MGLLADCKTNFKSQNLYEVLGASASATEKELKKAYYKASLKYHPDRVDSNDKEDATLKFQILGKIYSILSDKDKREVYDETGEVDEENLPEEKNWDQYWRLYFKKISVDDIKNFEKNYKGSTNELEDLKEAYMEGDGSMNHILENVLCATIDDEERFHETIKKWINKKEVPDFSNFSKETKRKKEARKRKAAREAEEAEEMKKDLGLNDSEDSLRQLIHKRSHDRAAMMDSYLDNLATKYAKGGKTSKGKSKK